MTTIENSRTMRFSRYFANNLEYASKVYMYKPNRKRAKSAPPGVDPDADNKDIETNKKVKKPKEDNTTQTRNNTRQKCATQTDKMEFVDTTTQTYEVDLRDTSAQTDGKIRTSTMQQTDAVLESNSDTSEESTKSDEIKQAFVEYKEIRLEDVKLTSKPSTTENEVSQPMDIKSENMPPLGDDGDLIAFKIRDDPRVVISIPSLSYTFKGDTFDKDWFKEAITAITKRIDRCGVLFDVEDTNIRMIFEEENSVSVPLSFQSPRYHYKCITMSDLQITENAEDTNIKGSITQLLTLEDRTNKNERVSFSPYKKDEQRKIRVPVVLLIMGGDLSALEHVAKALYFDISVVIVTGTGGTADFLDSSIKRKINIRYSLPIIFMQRFEDDIMLKIEEEMDRIHRKEWLLTFVEQGSDSEDIFWQKLSDGILRAWAFEKKQDKQDKVNHCDKQEISSTPVLPIAQHVLNEQIYCMMTKTELFGGFVLTQNIQEDESNEETLYIQRVIPGDLSTGRPADLPSYQMKSTMNSQISKIAAKSITNHDEIAVRAMLEKYGNRFLGGKKENAFAEILDDAQPESRNCLSLLKVVHKDAGSLTKKGKKVNIVETVTVVTEQLLKGMWVPMCGKKFSCSCKSSCSVSDVCCMRYQIDDKAEGEIDNSNKKQERSKQEAGNSKSKVRQDNDNTEKEVTKEQEKNVTNEKDEEVTKEKQEDVTKEKQEEVTNEKQEEVTKEKQEEVTKEKQEKVTKEKQEEVTQEKQEEVTKEKQEEVTKEKQEEVTTEINKKDCQNENKMNKKITSDVTQEDDDVTWLLRMVVLLNDAGSFYLWEYCDYPLQTALLASEYLKSMSATAEECFEEKLQKDLMKHSNDFKRRAILLLKELHAYNEKMAKQALDYVCKVWDVEESPIRFGHHYGIEEFISHSAAQKDASVRMFALDELPEEIECTIDQPKEPNNTTKTVIRSKAFKKHNLKTFVMHHWNYPGKLMCAPMMRIILHLTSFLLTLVLFSIFLTTKLNYTSISVMEGLVFVFMIGELIEEVISMIRPENGCGFSGLWVFMHLCNVWNILDFIFIFLYTLAFMLHTAALPSLIVHIRRLYSVSLLFMFLRLLNFFLLFKKIGIIVIMIKEMLTDLLYYLVILLVLLLGAGVVYHANLYPSHDVAAFPGGIDGWRIWTLLQLPFWQVFGDPNLDVIEGTDSNDCTYNESIWKNNPDISRCPNSEWITPIIAAFYMILTNWLLLNIVIAMFSARFEKVKQRASQKWRYYNHSVVIDYEYRYPFPFNIPIRTALWICRFENCKYCKKPKMPNENKNNTRKHEDKEVDLHKCPFPNNIPCPNDIPFPYNIPKQLGRILAFITDKCDCCKSKDSNVPYARVLFLGNERKIKEMLQKQREIAKKIVIQEKLDTNNVQTVYRSNKKLHE